MVCFTFQELSKCDIMWKIYNYTQCFFHMLIDTCCMSMIKSTKEQYFSSWWNFSAVILSQGSEPPISMPISHAIHDKSVEKKRWHATILIEGHPRCSVVHLLNLATKNIRWQVTPSFLIPLFLAATEKTASFCFGVNSCKRCRKMMENAHKYGGSRGIFLWFIFERHFRDDIDVAWCHQCKQTSFGTTMTPKTASKESNGAVSLKLRLQVLTEEKWLKYMSFKCIHVHLPSSSFDFSTCNQPSFSLLAKPFKKRSQPQRSRRDDFVLPQNSSFIAPCWIAQIPWPTVFPAYWTLAWCVPAETFGFLRRNSATGGFSLWNGWPKRGRRSKRKITVQKAPTQIRGKVRVFHFSMFNKMDFVCLYHFHIPHVKPPKQVLQTILLQLGKSWPGGLWDLLPTTPQDCTSQAPSLQPEKWVCQWLEAQVKVAYNHVVEVPWVDMVAS